MSSAASHDYAAPAVDSVSSEANFNDPSVTPVATTLAFMLGTVGAMVVALVTSFLAMWAASSATPDVPVLIGVTLLGTYATVMGILWVIGEREALN
jgi:hypothetical protein